MGDHEVLRLRLHSNSHVLYSESCANDVRDQEYQPLNSVMAALTGTKTPRQGSDHDGFCPTISAFHKYQRSLARCDGGDRKAPVDFRVHQKENSSGSDHIEERA